MDFPKLQDTWEEEHAIYKQPKNGKCSNSQFANGKHRVGYVPRTCPNDGGLRGMSCFMVCLDCGKEFDESLFVV